MLNYDDYIALFNTGDDAALIERFFADDVVFSGGSRDYQGRAALKGFLDWAHDGVREVMRDGAQLRRVPCLSGGDLQAGFLTDLEKVTSSTTFGVLCRAAADVGATRHHSAVIGR